MNPHSAHTTSPVALLKNLWLQRSLIATLTRREVEGRYKGSIFGSLWSLLTPLMILGVFTFVFGDIFQAKWNSKGNAAQEQGRLDFAAALFIGLLLYNFFAECLSKAPTLITQNPNYVKKIVFPLEVLPITTTLAALFHLCIAYLLVLLLIAFSGWQLTWSAAYAPIIIAPLIIIVLGLSWGLAAIGVYLRDVGQIISPLLTAIMFLSPIFYPLSSVSEKFLPLYLINPLTFTVEQTRNALLHGASPNWYGWLIYSIIALSMAYVGYFLFQKTRHGFSDVI